jgi:hypothetical protein
VTTEQEIVELRERVSRLEAAIGHRHNYNLLQAALRLNMSVSKTRAEVEAGRLKGRKNGSRWNFTAAQLADYEALAV